MAIIPEVNLCIQYLAFFCLLKCTFTYSPLGNLFSVTLIFLASHQQKLNDLWVCISFLKYVKLAKIPQKYPNKKLFFNKAFIRIYTYKKTIAVLILFSS